MTMRRRYAETAPREETMDDKHLDALIEKLNAATEAAICGGREHPREEVLFIDDAERIVRAWWASLPDAAAAERARVGKALLPVLEDA